MQDTVRIYENLRTVAYAPFYLAASSGGFQAQGLATEIVTSPHPTETAAGLLAGRVDVSWGGPMRVMMHHDADPGCPLVCFCQVVARDPFYLVGRDARAAFRFRDIDGVTLGVTNDVPTPWMTFQDDLHRAGIDPARVRRIPDAPMPALVTALRRGEADAIQVTEPHVDRLVEGGAGHIWHAFAERGDLGFTTFYTTRKFIENRPRACASLTRALEKALDEVHALTPSAIAARIAGYFPELDKGSLTRCVARYQASKLWARDTALRPTAYVRLKSALLSGGLIARDVPFDNAVDNRFSEEAVTP